MFSRIARSAILTYQRRKLSRPSVCVYEPTCSAYALDAIAKHGFSIGTWHAVWRATSPLFLGQCGLVFNEG